MDAAELRDLPLLEDLSEVTRGRVAPLLSRTDVAAGRAVFQKGDPPGDLYILEEGVAEAVIHVDEQPLVLSPLEAPTFFGEVSVLQQKPRSSAVQARTDLQLINVPLAALERIRESDPGELVTFYQRCFSITSERLRNANEVIVGYFRNLLEEQQRDRQETELRHLLVHDLRSPLAICESGLDLLLDKQDRYGRLTPKQERVLKRSRRSAAFLRQLVEQILEVGRSDSGAEKLETTTLETVLLDAVPQALGGIRGPTLARADLSELASVREELAEQGVHIVSEPESLLREPLVVDRLRLTQVLLNLVGNALKHAPGWLTVRLERRDGKLHVAVIDRGSGIPDDYRAVIFDTRWQSKAKLEGVQRGFGLGLAGVARLIQGLSGTIRAEAGPGGVGTAIRFSIPWRTER